MIKSIYIAPGGSIQNDLSTAQIKAAAEENEGLLWVSLEQFEDRELTDILDGVFHFHPLSIEDCQSTGFQLPKVDDFTSYIFLILHHLTLDEATKEVEAQ